MLMQPGPEWQSLWIYTRCLKGVPYSSKPFVKVTTVSKTTFANMDPDEAQQNIGPHLRSNCCAQIIYQQKFGWKHRLFSYFERIKQNGFFFLNIMQSSFTKGYHHVTRVVYCCAKFMQQINPTDVWKSKSAHLLKIFLNMWKSNVQ